MGLTFTHKAPVNTTIRFLVLSLEFYGGNVCWRHQASSCKWFLLFDSEHEEKVKRWFTIKALTSALKKSCAHQVDRSFDIQKPRLHEDGYPNALLIAIFQNIPTTLKKRSGRHTTNKQEKPVSPIVQAPNLHGITHRLKKIAGRQVVQAVCSAPNKTYSMCGKINKPQNTHENQRDLAHHTTYALCQKEVIHKIPIINSSTRYATSARYKYKLCKAGFWMLQLLYKDSCHKIMLNKLRFSQKCPQNR